MNPLVSRIGRAFANFGQAIGGYTEQVTAAAEADASGGAFARHTAICEAISSSHERAFSQGRLVGGDASMRAAVSPGLLGLVGRTLIETGEFVGDVDRTADGRWRIRPAAGWLITGGGQSDDPMDWTYRLTAPAPAGTIERTVPRDRVVHVTVRADISAPHAGRGLWGLTRHTADAASASEMRLKEELSAVVGQVFSHPGTVNADQSKTVKDKLRQLKGGIAMITQKPGMDGRGQQQMQALRIGPNPPETLAVLRGQTAELLALSSGLPGSFVRGGRGSEQRESLRVMLFLTILPLAGLLSAELSRVFQDDVSLEFSRLTAADLSGRARAVKQMVDAGVDLERSLSLAGFSE